MLYNGSKFSNFRVSAKNFLNKSYMPINGSMTGNFREAYQKYLKGV
jgi:hypothetical protein